MGNSSRNDFKLNGHTFVELVTKNKCIYNKFEDLFKKRRLKFKIIGYRKELPYKLFGYNFGRATFKNYIECCYITSVEYKSEKKIIERNNGDIKKIYNPIARDHILENDNIKKYCKEMYDNNEAFFRIESCWLLRKDYFDFDVIYELKNCVLYYEKKNTKKLKSIIYIIPYIRYLISYENNDVRRFNQNVYFDRNILKIIGDFLYDINDEKDQLQKYMYYEKKEAPPIDLEETPLYTAAWNEDYARDLRDTRDLYFTGDLIVHGIDRVQDNTM